MFFRRIGNFHKINPGDKVKIVSTFSDIQASPVTKMLLIGDTGSGKTGALASLLAAGYNVRILDLDRGVQVLGDFLTNPSSIYTKANPGLWTSEQVKDITGRLHFETVTDSMKNINGKLVPKAATVWQRSCKILDNWPGLGPISQWTPKDVLVIDSLTFLCAAALDFVKSMNARLGQPAHQSDWYAGQQLIESLLQMLYDTGVNCNVIVNCHIAVTGPEGTVQKGQLVSLGKSLSPKIGRYFNTMLMAKTSGIGTSNKRQIVTGSTTLIELKSTIPLRVKPAYDLATGLAEYFAAERQFGTAEIG